MNLTGSWHSLDMVANLLRRQGRRDLAHLLAHSQVTFDWHDEVTPLDGTPDIDLLVAVVYSPFQNYNKLCSLSETHTNEILQGLQTI